MAKTTSWFRLSAAALAVAAWATFSAMAAQPRSSIMPPGAKANDRAAADADRKLADREFQEGNFLDAYKKFREAALDLQADPRQVGGSLDMAVQCLQRLDRVAEIDALLEESVRAHGENWRLLQHAAVQYMRIPHYGFTVAGKFERGQHRGGGRMVNAVERDRIRALQLMTQALPLVAKDNDRVGAGNCFLTLADVLLNNRGYGESWRLQSLSNLNALPDYEEGWEFGRDAAAAPVDAAGKPVFYRTPKDWASAASDGERWRWCLEQAAAANPAERNAMRMRLAEFLQSQFGVQTLAEAGWRFAPGVGGGDDANVGAESGVYALRTLKENETIARLAGGVKRFDLPDDSNYIKIYQTIAADPRAPQADTALERLAQEFENRQQYLTAAGCYRRLLEEFPNATADQRQTRQRQLDQIVGNWGRFEPLSSQPAGRTASIEYCFRNGRSVEFTAHEINVEKLLSDVQTFLESSPVSLDWRKIDIGDIGHRLVVENQRKYIGRQVAQWSMPLRPRENHFNGRVTVRTPVTSPGAYLVSAKMADGNTSFIVLWINDTAIVKKPMEGRTLYFVADAVTGQPVAGASLQFFGWKEKWSEKPPRREVLTRRFPTKTDADGQTVVRSSKQPADMQWLVTARTDEGRFAYLGFTGVWFGRRYDAEYDTVKAYTITDRPVYRPAQKVHYKFWVRHAKYDMEDTSEFADRDFRVEITDPRGEKIVSENRRTDAYGGIEGEYALPADAPLGVFGLRIFELQLVKGERLLGSGGFRVEEYKKPEYEVSIDAPTEPVMLGETIAATIRAKYYFGSPVTHAKVRYKVQRAAHEKQWYPVGPWDWLYGAGYGWLGCDPAWYPGWRNWGCPRPAPFWRPWRPQPPELVADREVEIGPDGTVRVEIDTAVAKAAHPDQDHCYTITAEVIDASRRTIVGVGRVLVARKPFSVGVHLDRGYYRAGDTIEARFVARALDGKPVAGRGKLQLLKVAYRNNKPVETSIETWSLDTGEDGTARQRITVAGAGQYRLSYKLTASHHAADNTDEHRVVEGGCLFTVVGEGFFNGTPFRFNPLELVPDKREYAPGETVWLQINADRAGGTVLLFVRPTNGVYQPPKMIRLEGKSAVEEIGVAQRDMPNFFVEAVTVADGRVYTETREIVVPPEKRVLSVEVRPTKDVYRPGEKARVKIALRDFFDKPFVGTTVAAIYDKSIEYISGGGNTPDIKAFFWRWRRQHHPQTEDSLERWSSNLVPPETIGMANLGIFDDSTIAEASEDAIGMGTAGVFSSDLGGPRAKIAMTPTRAAPMASAMEASVNGVAAPAVEPTVRKKFADTALWVGALTTDENGEAEVSLDMPENLTTWRIKVWGLGHGTRVGQGQTDVITRKDLIVRMEAPRFFVQKDEVVLSAVVHNYLKTKKKVQVSLKLGGKCLEVIPEGDKLNPKPGSPVALNTGATYNAPVEIEPNGEARVDWRVAVLDEGEAVVCMKAVTDEESDAMEQAFPCYIHGMLKTESYCGVVRPKETVGKFTFNVPGDRRPAQSRLDVQFSPTLVGAMVDALPYLAHYPYGCTEQTLNRFLPTVITQKILLGMKLDLKEMQKKRAETAAADAAAHSPIAGPVPACNPVFDEAEVRQMVRAGVGRLAEMQRDDGGWGWFSGWGERSDPHMTALVVHGLQIARQNDVVLTPGLLERGVEWLQRYRDEQIRLLKNGELKERPTDTPWRASADDLDAFVDMVLVDAGRKNDAMREFLYRDRTRLAVYGMAMYGLALEKQGEKEKLVMILKNIGQYVERDDENQTAWLRLPGDGWWRWYGSEYEAHAYYLKLLARTEPKGELARRLAKYLLNGRKNATHWNSTRDTALCVEAVAEFFLASGEEHPNMAVEIYYDGQLRKTFEITPKNLLLDHHVVLEGEAIAPGRHVVELRKKGPGPLYYSALATNFTLEDFITKAGLEIKVERKYYKLVKADKTAAVAGSHGQVVEEKVEKYERRELKNLSEVKSGDLVEVELEVQSKNDYEYLIFEDMKPAGFEPVDLRSGYTGNDLGAYVEFRDNRVVFFVRELARGKHSVAYRMRAETPGRFSALPTRARAMYAPELRANSDELKIRVGE